MAKKTLLNKALFKAVNAVGGQSELARALTAASGKRVKQGHIWSWLYRTGNTPAERVLDIERITAGKVSRYELRPDLYPKEEHPPE